MNDLPIQIRGSRDGDIGLIVQSWVGSHRPACRWLPKVDHDSRLRAAVRESISGCPVWVACDPEHPDHVFGWICADVHRSPPLLHYVFVKSKFRGLGLAQRLLAAVVEESGSKLTATCWTRAGIHLLTHPLVDGFRPDYFNPLSDGR